MLSKIASTVFFSFVLLLGSGCNSSLSVRETYALRKVDKIRSKYPRLFHSEISFQTELDTLAVFLPEFQVSGVFNSKDTVVLDTGRLKVEYLPLDSSRFLLRSRLVRDTVFVLQTDTVAIHVNNSAKKQDTRYTYPLKYVRVAIFFMLLVAFFAFFRKTSRYI